MKIINRTPDFKQALAAQIKEQTVLENATEAKEALGSTVLAMRNLSRHLAKIDFGETNPCDQCGRKGLSAQQSGQTLAYFAKMVNEITRLLQFAKGEADSRTEVVGLGDLLKYLDNDKFDQVTKWIEEGQAHEDQSLLPARQ